MAASGKPNPGIRKVWVPKEMKEALNEYCWRNRTKPSPFVVGLVREIVAFPERYEETEVPPAGQSHLSVYIEDSLWEEGLATAKSYKVHLSAMIRVGIARELESERIPWDTSTIRPKNTHIPMKE